MHTIEHDHVNGKTLVGYEYTDSEGQVQFVTHVTCSSFRVAMEFVSYLNGGNAPDDSSWNMAVLADKV